jgi:SOS-response transcriptional repressor LexA
MPNDEKQIEQMIQESGASAPRLTPDQIDAKIVKTYFHVAPNTTLTICVLTLENGFTVIGESAAASPANFNEEIGQKIAFDNARNKIWQLEGYLLRDRLHAIAMKEKANG